MVVEELRRWKWKRLKIVEMEEWRWKIVEVEEVVEEVGELRNLLCLLTSRVVSVEEMGNSSCGFVTSWSLLVVFTGKNRDWSVS